jgi:hypothetical protein
MAFTVVFLFGCASSNTLNKHIYKIQKEHLDVTPFVKDLGPMYSKISRARKFRGAVLKKFFRDVYNEKDTVIVKESFGKMQFGYNLGIDIVYRDTNYFFTKNYTTKRGQLISRKDHISSYGNTHTFDMQLQIKDSIRHEFWNVTPTHYGTDCRDADPVFISVLYPAGNIECLYVRCWLTPEQIRGKQNK